jgi:hypothetical protein
MELSGRKLLFALAGAVTLLTALVLFFFALFPYIFAESGSASYARAHRTEATLQVIGGAALLWIAWQCFRRSIGWRGVLAAIALTVVVAGIASMRDSRAVPANVHPIGGAFHAVTEQRPSEIDTVMYDLYYKRGSRYEEIESMAGEFRFIAPECLWYRGLKVVGRPIYAMCGYRIPVETFDTLLSESEILDRARAQPAYRDDWRYRRATATPTRESAVP